MPRFYDIQSYPDLPSILGERRNARYIGGKVDRGIGDIDLPIRLVFEVKERGIVNQGKG